MTETSPLLGRCREEGCNHVLFLADRALVQEADSFKEVKAGNVVYRCQNAWWSRCPNRHKVFPLKSVKGTYSPDHKCDARCLNAKGHDCTCSCGGANHGRGYAVEVQQAIQTVQVPHEGRVFNVPVPRDSENVREMMAAQVARAREARLEDPDKREPQHLGEVGKHIRGEVTVESFTATKNDSVIYRFVTKDGDAITWFAPSYADPQWSAGSTHTIRAKVKRHDNHERFGKSTIVTYVEEV